MANLPPISPRKDIARSRRIKNIASIGDSIITYQGSFGYAFTGLTITGVELRGGSINTPSGTASLTWNVTNSTLTYTAPGDTTGTPVVVTDGMFELTSGTTSYTLRVGVFTRLLPSITKTDTLTTGIRYWRRSSGSFQYIIDALTNRRFNFMRDFGIGGNTTADMVKRYAQIVNANPDLILENGGTNDTVAASATPQSIAQNRSANWELAKAAGIPVLALLISPRSGALTAKGAAGTDSASVTTFGPRIVQANNLITAAAQAPGNSSIMIMDNVTNLTDTVTGKVLDYATEDGLHLGGNGALEYAYPVVAALNVMSPDTKSTCNISNVSYYNATTNPTGNLLGVGQGSFQGTGGTVSGRSSLTPAWAATTAIVKDGHVIVGGNLYRALNAGTTGSTAPSHTMGSVVDGSVTWMFMSSGVTSGFGAGWTLQAGITAGTGLGAGLNASKGGPAGMAAIANKVPATDGGPDWQEFVISGADTDGNFIKVFFGNPTLPNPGDLVTMKFDFEVNGTGCYGLFMDCIFTTTGFNIIWDANQMSSITQGIRPGVGSGTGTISMKPIVWPSGVTSITPRIFIQSKAGASFSVKLRNADLRKVI